MLLLERSVPAIALATTTRHSEFGLEFAVAHPAFAAFTLAAWHSIEDAVVAIEAALRAGTITTDSLRRAATVTLAGCKGIGRFRQALRLSNRHSESPRESGLKVKLWRAGLPPPLQQAQVYSKAGVFLGRPDFLFDDASSLIVEYDGRGKYHGADQGENAAAMLGAGAYDPAYTFDALNSERDREKMLLNQGFRVVRVYGDIYDDPQTVWDIAAAHGGGRSAGTAAGTAARTTARTAAGGGVSAVEAGGRRVSCVGVNDALLSSECPSGRVENVASENGAGTAQPNGAEASAARPAGRYAPSPSGDLHLGNLRTAVLAWLIATTEKRPFRLRIDDIDAQRSTAESASRQLEDLGNLGITHDGPIVRQQETIPHYRAALKQLQDAGLVYECYCSRKDIADAQRAPHALPGRYPGTCRHLTPAEREQRRSDLRAQGRMWSLRLVASEEIGGEWAVRERLAVAHDPGRNHGSYRGEVDDMVLRRGGNIERGHADDGAGGHADDFAYNLCVVVDDALAGVGQVVRGDDLLSSAPRQAYLAHLLGLPEVDYVHVPLVLGPEGRRLAKRDGAVTLRELPGGASEGMRWIRASLGGAVDQSLAFDANTPPAVVLSHMGDTFDLAELSREPVIWR